MARIFILIETAGVEILGVHAYGNRKAAEASFARIALENSVAPCEDLSSEITGTLSIAGDDAYAVQLLEVELSGYVRIPLVALMATAG